MPVFSDECYCEFTWTGPARSILEHGLDGVVAVHSLSKRSNLAGLRVGFYAGDAELVTYLTEVRRHVGLMVPGPAQMAGIAALEDDDHVAVQRGRYQRRLERTAAILSRAGIDVPNQPAVSICGSPSTTVGPSPRSWRPTARPREPGTSGTAGPPVRGPWYKLDDCTNWWAPPGVS